MLVLCEYASSWRLEMGKVGGDSEESSRKYLHSRTSAERMREEYQCRGTLVATTSASHSKSANTNNSNHADLKIPSPITVLLKVVVFTF